MVFMYKMYVCMGLAHLVDIPLLDLRPARYLLPGVLLAAEECAHGVDVAAVVWAAGRLRTPECEYGVEGFLSVRPVEEVFFKNRLDYT